MALTTEELVAVVAGSLAGLVVLLVALAIILYICVGRQRRKGRRKDKKQPFKHHHLTPDTSLSKNSALNHSHGDPRGIADPRMDPRLDPRLDPRMDPRLDPRLDSRLPKVGSSNLWFGTPSLYSGGPSPVYQDMKKKGNSRPHPEQPSLQGIKVLPSMVVPYGVRAAPNHGHMVYQGATSANMGRIYHSQQVAPTGYEPGYPLARSGSFVDLYSYPYSYDPYRDISNSHAVLMEYPESNEYYLDRYREREVRRTGKRIKRSQSDVTLHSTRRPKNRKQRGEAPFDREDKSQSKSRATDKDNHDRHDMHKERSHSHDRVLSRETQERKGSSDSRERTTTADIHRARKPAPPPPKPKPQRQELQATSMQFTDNEIPQSATDSAKLRAIERERERERVRERERNHENIHAVHISSRQEITSDHSRDNHGYVHDEHNNPDDDLNIRPYNYEGKPSKYESSIVAKMAALADTPKATYVNRQSIHTDTNNLHSSKESFHAEVAKKLEKLQENTHVPAVIMDEGPVATSTGKHSRASRPTSGKGRRSRRDSTGTNPDGKEAQDAFDFLDGYSDGEGTDFIGSGHITPTQMRDYDVTF